MVSRSWTPLYNMRESVRVRVAAVSSNMATGSATRKRERVILSIEDKTGVIDMLNHGSSLTSITTKYSIVKSTVSDIKNNKEKILTFKREMADMGMSLKAKTMRLGDNYHYNYIIIIFEENINFAILQLSQTFYLSEHPSAQRGSDKRGCTVFLCLCSCC